MLFLGVTKNNGMINHSTLKIFLSTFFICLSISFQAQDLTPPEFDLFEVELEVECSSVDEVIITATDDESDVIITYSDAIFSGGCTDNIVRTYTATDESGNSNTAIQILVVVDETPPVFLGVGEDMTISCEEGVPEIPEVTVYDECSDIEIEEFNFETSFEEGECIQIITWTWSAVDECGNYGTHVKTITIVDETAPEFSEDPDDFYLSCEEDYPSAPEISAIDNCTDVTITYSEEIIEGGLEEEGSTYCTAQDVDFLQNSFSMKLINSPAQENYTTSDLVLMQMPDMGSGITAVLSGNVFGFDNPNAGWYVYMEFEDGMDWDAWSTQDFPTSYRDDFNIAEETHLDWTYLLMNSTNSYLMGLGDYEGSELQLSHMPANYYYAFQLGMGAPNFTSNYGLSGWFLAEGIFFDSESNDESLLNGVEFSSAGDIYTDLVCCPIESLVRTWVAEDECENISSVQQIITKIDVFSPEFTFVPDDLLLDCSEEVPLVIAEVTDNCGDPTVTFFDEIETSECLSEYTIYRTFTAVDNCGLSVEATQIITVIDELPPVLVNAPESEIIDCEDSVPPAPEVVAIDECDGELEVEFTEEIIGDLGPEGAEAYCVATTPIETELGWSGVLFDDLLGDVLVSTTEAYYTQYPDEGDGVTGHITATLQSLTNENAGWDLELTLVNGLNWDDWSNQEFPTSYKDDLGDVGNLYEEWTYFILESGSLVGWGDWDGTALELSHAPINYYYGFQLGNQAANVNSQYGIGGWMYYSGTMYDDVSESIVLIDGAGDLAFDLNCCPMYSVIRTWTVEDCAGNSVEHVQEISFDDLGGFPEPENDFEDEFSLAGVYIEDLLKIDVTPNPIKAEASITVDSRINIDMELKLYSSQGLFIQTIWEGDLEKNTIRKVPFNKGDLTAGVYILKLITNSGEVSKKLIIEE